MSSDTPNPIREHDELQDHVLLSSPLAPNHHHHGEMEDHDSRDVIHGSDLLNHRHPVLQSHHPQHLSSALSPAMDEDDLHVVGGNHDHASGHDHRPHFSEGQSLLPLSPPCSQLTEPQDEQQHSYHEGRSSQSGFVTDTSFSRISSDNTAPPDSKKSRRRYDNNFKV
jgi:hypothetical protein